MIENNTLLLDDINVPKIVDNFIFDFARFPNGKRKNISPMGKIKF